MFDGIRNFLHHEDSSVKKAGQHFNEKANPLKEMVVDLAKVIGKEVESNEKLNPEADFELLVRNPGKESNLVTHLRAIHRDDLTSILDKVKLWEEDKTPTELPLLPREIEALQQIANAIEKKELVIKQGEQFVAHEQSGVYNAILNHAASIEKADQLGRQKIIGRAGGKDGEVVLGDLSDREKLEALYDVFSEEDDRAIKEAFDKSSRFSDKEYRPEVENFDYSEEDLINIKQKRASFSKSYKEDEEAFTAKYHDLGRALKEQYDLTIKNLGSESGENSSKGNLGRAGGLELTGGVKGQTPQEIGQLRVAEETRRASKSVFLKEEREKDREARLERDHIKRLEKDLDDKFERIQQEEKNYEIRHENDPPKSPD